MATASAAPIASQLRSSLLSSTTKTLLATPRGISGTPLRDLHSKRRTSLTVVAVSAEKPTTFQVVQPINGDPFIGSLETPVTSSPLIAWYLSNLPAYRTAVSPLLRGIEVGLAHGFLLVGPFVKTGPLRNTEYAGAAGSLAAAGLVVILSIVLTMYGVASFKEGEPSVAPSLTLTGENPKSNPPRSGSYCDSSGDRTISECLNNMSSVCPFTKSASAAGGCPVKSASAAGGCPVKSASAAGGCPVKSADNCNKNETGHIGKVDKESKDSGIISPKCPFGYDSQTFKLGPLSCMICQALLFESSKCSPCCHKFCKTCISRFKDCPLCGADIEKIEPDAELQVLVDRFIDGHARIQRSPVNADAGGVMVEKKDVIYGDVSMERGAFLVQQAMRAFHAKNIESAKSRLSLCAEDIRDQLQTLGNTSELCSQLGAVLGMLGDCCRATGDSGSAVTYYEESVEFLSKLTAKDLELVHTLSVSLNKIGDLKYYGGDLLAARSYYTRCLEVRRNAAQENSKATSQIVDLATSLAKVADVDRGLGNEDVAISGFQEAIECLESLKLDAEEIGLEKRRRSVLDFVHNQLAESQKLVPVSPA